MASITLLVLIVLVVVVVESWKYEYNATDVYENYMEDKDKTYFLRYYLGKGYVESSSQHLIRSDINHHKVDFPHDLNIPEDSIYRIEKFRIADPIDFALHLYKKFVSKFNLTSGEALQIAMGDQICFPNGECVDPDDSGTVCCT